MIPCPAHALPQRSGSAGFSHNVIGGSSFRGINMSRTGKVFVQGRYAGTISETDSGYLFQYDRAYIKENGAVAASMTLPLSTDAYFSNTLFPFFDGLIPEGWLLNVVERNWKIDSRDRFGIMLASCRDCIGDVRIEAEEG